MDVKERVYDVRRVCWKVLGMARWRLEQVSVVGEERTCAPFVEMFETCLIFATQLNAAD